MESGINLLPEVTEKEIKAGVYRRKTVVVAIGSLVLIGVVIIALLSYQVYLSISANDIQARADKAITTINEPLHSTLEISSLALKEKINKIQQTLESEIPTSTLIEQVQTAATKAISPAIQISGISSSSDGTLTVDGAAAGSQVFSKWIDNLTDSAGVDYFAKINLVSLTGTPGNYKFSFQMNFLKKGVYQPAK
jgi:hypothetical protein